LDQPAEKHGGISSLKSNCHRLKVVDTFRAATRARVCWADRPAVPCSLHLCPLKAVGQTI